MISRDRLIFTAVLISVIGTSSLFLMTADSSVNKVSISDIDEGLVGSKVKVKGRIYDIESYDETVYIRIKDEENERSVKIRVDRTSIDDLGWKEELKTGAVITATGIIDKYDGEYILETKNRYSLELKKKVYHDFVPIESLLENPDWYEGMHVKIRGEVSTLELSNGGLETEINPLDGGYKRINCFIKNYTPQEDQTLVKNTPIEVKGEFRYNHYTGRWEIITEKKPKIHTE